MRRLVAGLHRGLDGRSLAIGIACVAIVSTVVSVRSTIVAGLICAAFLLTMLLDVDFRVPLCAGVIGVAIGGVASSWGASAVADITGELAFGFLVVGLFAGFSNAQSNNSHRRPK